MREAVLLRIEHTDQGTFGVLSFGASTVRSLELPWRSNRVQRSCIPQGRYRCAMVRSPRFGRVYGVHDVPGRSHILIHAANLAGDIERGWETQLHGCIAPFRTHGRLRTATGRMQRAGLVSRPALTELMAWGAGQPFDLLIKDFVEP